MHVEHDVPLIYLILCVIICIIECDLELGAVVALSQTNFHRINRNYYSNTSETFTVLTETIVTNTTSLETLLTEAIVSNMTIYRTLETFLSKPSIGNNIITNTTIY